MSSSSSSEELSPNTYYKQLERGVREAEIRAEIALLERELEELEAGQSGKESAGGKYDEAQEETIWTKEAARLAASKETHLGRPTRADEVEETTVVSSAPQLDPDTHYVLTGRPSYLLLTTYYLLLATYYLLLAAYYLQLATYYLLFTTYYVLRPS